MKKLSLENHSPVCLVGVISNKDFLYKDSTWFLHPSIESHLRSCHVVEFRADTFSHVINDITREEDILVILESFCKIIQNSELLQHLQILFTLRLKEDGGLWNVLNPRQALFEKALPLVDWIDIELEHMDLFLKLKSKIEKYQISYICSHHQFNLGYSLDKYQRQYRQMQSYSPDMVKIAVFCQNKKELFSLLEFVKKTSFPNLACFISMGSFGKISRIVSPLLGAKVVYGFLGTIPLVEGQVSILELKENILFYSKLDQSLSVSDWVQRLED